MAELNMDKMAKEVAEKAFDDYVYQGKTIREWIAIIAKNVWIPVSKRLPEETGIYLCTVYCGRCGYRVFECSFYNAMSGWSNEDVVAWMPLPEPWKGESE